MRHPALVLASASPRRIELLRAAGFEFTVSPGSVDESHDAAQGLAGLVLGNARAKAVEAAARHRTSVVIAADTLVWLQGRPLGKPADADEARVMLRHLSGRTHEVATGVHILRLDPPTQTAFHEVTRVRFRPLADPLIDDYLALVNVMDKAGAYAVQEHGETIIEHIEGSKSNVAGLPVERVASALQRHFDLRPVTRRREPARAPRFRSA